MIEMSPSLHFNFLPAERSSWYDLGTTAKRILKQLINGREF